MPFTPESLPELAGRTFLLTGGNGGIGFETTKNLLKKNAKVYITARSAEKAESAIAKLKELVPNADVHFILMDLMDLQSVVDGTRDFLSKESSLHCLILNAGIMATPHEISKDGWEAQFQTNYLSHFLLTSLLLPVLRTTAARCTPGTVRIVEVSSDLYAFAPCPGIEFEDRELKNYGVLQRYMISKLANILHIKELQKKIGPKGDEPEMGEIWVASLHPGVVQTNLSSTFLGNNPLMKLGAIITPPVKVEIGALNSTFAAASNDFGRDWSGAYIVPTAKKNRTWRYANDEALAEKLWNWTEEELRTKGFLQ